MMTPQELDRAIATAMTDAHDAEASAERVMAALAGPLPPQHRRSPWREWPAELIGLDFAPAWPRIAALAAVACLGFTLGLSGGTRLVDLVTAPGAPPGAADLLSTVFEPDLLPGIRP